MYDKKILVIMAAGKSSRFPNMKPKWMLTHPDGKMMIEHVIDGIDTSKFDSVHILIRKEHDDKFNASTILEQALPSIQIDKIVDSNSPVETINQFVKFRSDTPLITIKDCDCVVELDYDQDSPYIGGLKINENSEIRNIQNKSFIKSNQDGFIQSITEKHIVSDTICTGVYCADSRDIVVAIEKLSEIADLLPNRELYLSDVFEIIANTKKVRLVETTKFIDFGTKEDWENIRSDMKTYFVDVDGVLVKNVGKYGVKNWSTKPELLMDNVNALISLKNKGAQIILTSSRDFDALQDIVYRLCASGLCVDNYISKCNHSERVLINDFAPTNKYPSCSAISIPRNGNLGEYL